MDISLLGLESLAGVIRDAPAGIDLIDLAAQLDHIDREFRVSLTAAQYSEKRPAPTVRARAKVTTSVKGVRTTESTLEWDGDIRDYDIDVVMDLREVLTESLDKVYPPPELAD